MQLRALSPKLWSSTVNVCIVFEKKDSRAEKGKFEKKPNFFYINVDKLGLLKLILKLSYINVHKFAFLKLTFPLSYIDVGKLALLELSSKDYSLFMFT